MEGDKGKSYAEIDKEAIEKYNRLMRETLEREEKMTRHWEWRGNKLPPFSIEPMPFERQRLSEPMTAEQRALRKQWVQDQHLSPNEPRNIPELNPKNVFRRMWSNPLNAVLYRSLVPMVGDKVARSVRFVVPKAIVTLGIACFMWYNVKYSPASWVGKNGWHVYGTKDRVFPGDVNWPNGPEKAYDDFFDKGFKSRTAIHDLRTSYTS